MKTYSLVIHNNLTLTGKGHHQISTDMLRKAFEKRTHSFLKGFSIAKNTKHTTSTPKP